MTTTQSVRLAGQTAYDSLGQKIGEVQRVFYDQPTNEPVWLTIRSEGSEPRESFVPVSGAQLTASGVALAVRKDVIQGAPQVAAGTELGADDASRLDRYYQAMLSSPPGTPARA